MKKATIRETAITALLLISGAIVSGCGGNDATEDTASSAEQTATPSSPATERQDRDVATAARPDSRSDSPDASSDSPIVGSSPASRRASAPEQPHMVGRQVCKECHSENFSLHAHHGHANTFAMVDETDVAEHFVGHTFDGGEAYGTYTYKIDDQGRLVAMLPERFGDQEFPLQYVLGSGHGALTLLTLLSNPAGQTVGVEHRATWYSSGDKLALTPGHETKSPRGGAEFFGDLSHGTPLERCIYCHTTSATITGDQIHDLVPSVNCEKCHGPGSEHVRQARASDTPPPYSVGRADWDIESEIQLCGDCHRLPRAITEKELREYPDLLVRFQPVGMLRSECYLKSDGRLKCTTCHPPHTSLHEMSKSDHIANCIACHQPDESDHVVCPISTDDGCIKCHMRPVEQATGLIFHDHWIRSH